MQAIIMDKISIERIQTLHPSIRKKKAEQDYLAANKLLPNGVRLRITQALRTWDEQKNVICKGEQKGIIVTKAKSRDSWHNYGLAIDIVIILDTNNDGLFETAFIQNW